MCCSRTYPRMRARQWRHAPWPVGKARADGYEPRRMERQTKSHEQVKSRLLCRKSLDVVHRSTARDARWPGELHMPEISLGDLPSITATTTMTTRRWREHSRTR